MGARPEDYARAAPDQSFIHVDQFMGPKDLAEFLFELDRIDQKYNKYFEVILKKSCFAYNVLVLVESTEEFINTRLFCRVCALLHQTQVREDKY